MRKLIFPIILVYCLLSTAHAALLVSGDLNIINTTETSHYEHKSGNDLFFSNILEGGTNVLILESDLSTITAAGDIADTDLNNYYNSLVGVNSSLFSGSFTNANLTGVDLFISILPDDAFTTQEISALDSFMAGGGSVFLIGENNLSIFPTRNDFINTALSELGSNMRINDDMRLDDYFHVATGSQIAVDPFTAGISEFKYASTSEVTGGNPLFFTQDMEDPESKPYVTSFVAYENMGSGTSSVPEPSTILLFGFGLLGLAGARRRE